MAIYKHRQTNKLLVFVVFVIAIVLAIAISIWQSSGLSSLVIMIIVMTITSLLFYSLTVEIDSNYLTLRFGIGVIRKTYRLDNLSHPRVIRYPWYYGWGIRRVPRGWLFNIAGFDAVELQLKNKAHRRVCIGTDQPELLLSVIEAALGEPDRQDGETS